MFARSAFFASALALAAAAALSALSVSALATSPAHTSANRVRYTLNQPFLNRPWNDMDPRTVTVDFRQANAATKAKITSPKAGPVSARWFGLDLYCAESPAAGQVYVGIEDYFTYSTLGTTLNRFSFKLENYLSSKPIADRLIKAQRRAGIYCVLLRHPRGTDNVDLRNMVVDFVVIR